MTYFIMYQGRPIGPLNINQVFGYTRDANTPVSRDGGPWNPLSSYPELAERLARLTPTPAPAGLNQRTVSFGEAIARGFRGYFTFTGRSSRSEFWFWFLFYFIISIPLSAWLQSSMNTEVYYDLLESLQSGVIPSNFSAASIYTDGGTSAIIYTVISVLFFIPNLAISIRRLHDSGHSGWWMLLILILFPACDIGDIIMLVFAIQPSQPTENKYGPVPNLE